MYNIYGVYTVNHILYEYSVYTVFLAGESPNIRSYTVHIHASGQPTYLGLARTICTIYTVYKRYFWQGNHEIYGHTRCISTVLANPSSDLSLHHSFSSLGEARVLVLGAGIGCWFWVLLLGAGIGCWHWVLALGAGFGCWFWVLVLGAGIGCWY